MSNYRKQHVIPKTYLKHFSTNSDGIGLFVIDNEHEYKLGIQKRNSGDKIFWEKNYSDTAFFEDRKAIEKIFANHIEHNYNSIVHVIEKENPTVSLDVKEELIKWIFYTKLRSPIWENHIKNFTSELFFEKSLNEFITHSMSMRWTIYKSPNNEYWWTSDNPGCCLNLKEYELTEKIIPTPIYEFNGVDTILFYPLTKKYCLNIHPYLQGEDVNLNITNTDITIECVDSGLLKQINYLTLITQKRLIISTNYDSLKKIEELKMQI